MREWQAYDGRYYHVSDAHAAKIDAVFGSSWPSEDAARSMLAHILELDRRGELTVVDEARKTACDHICNLHSKVRHLKGRDHKELFEAIDHVGGNTHFMPCGCRLTTVFDWHKAQRGDPYDVHPHYPARICERHKQLGNDFRALHEAVMEEHRTKADA